MKQVFISHTPHDRRHAQTLGDYLNAAGYKVRKPRGGSNWSLELFDLIRRCDVVIPILTEHAIESVEMTYEWSIALSAGVLVFPVLFRGINAHPHLMILNYYDFGAHHDEHDAWEQFMRELQRVLGDEVQMTRLEPEKRVPPPAQPTHTTQQFPLSREPALPPPNQRSNRPTGYYLFVQRGNNPPEEYPLQTASITLGRESRNDIQIKEEGVSRSHLRFVRGESGYQVVDMGSTNGTMNANGEKIQSMKLRTGDVLKIGEHIIMTYRFID